jgi:hypothetical protein
MMMEQKDLGPVWRGPVGTQGPACGEPFLLELKGRLQATAT